MSYQFLTSVNREESNAEKYRLRKALFKTEDVLPVWVADMDIDTPDFVLDAIKKRLKHPIIGYEEVPLSAFEAQCNWMKKEHSVTYKPEDMFYSHSVVASMIVAIEAFTKEGEGVIVQTPVYAPFFHSVHKLNRKLVKNPLRIKDDGSYTFDIEDLIKKIDKTTKLLLLCSPHNPVGRVWREEELKQIVDICIKNNIIVFSDEIHSDLVYKNNKHIPFSSLSHQASEICLSAIGVGKTFNMAGFAMSSVVITNPKLKEKFQKSYERVHFAQGAVLSHVAFESAYRDGKEWLEDLKLHLYKNYELLQRVVQKHSKLIKLTPIEATYLAWLDCRGLKFSNRDLRNFFIQDAKLGLNAGISFGKEGSGFMRLNFALDSAKMSEVIRRVDKALEKRRIELDNN